MSAFARRVAVAGLIAAKALSERVMIRDRPAVTLSTLRGWRYPVFLLHALTSVAVVGLHWRDVSTAVKMIPPRVFWRRIRIASFLPARQRGVFLFDSTQSPHHMAAEREVALDRRYYASAGRTGVFRVPYFAHPDFYAHDLMPLARELASRPDARPLTLFFSGTAEAAHYAAAARFSVVIRTDILAHLQRRLQEPRFAALRSRSEIHVQDDVTDSTSKYRYRLPEYLGRMAEADFALCPPGCGMPHSHNIIEAMAVGAIPLTNYAEWMTPPLRHGVDCLAFTTLDELDRAIETLAGMNQEAVSAMRQAVRDYYSRYLEPAAVGRRLLEQLPHIDGVAVNDETGR